MTAFQMVISNLKKIDRALGIRMDIKVGADLLG